MRFEEVVQTVENYNRRTAHVFCVGELETLRKNGRLNGDKAMVASALNIKPVMGATPRRNDLPVGAGKGHQARFDKNGRADCKRMYRFKEKDIGNCTL